MLELVVTSLPTPTSSPVGVTSPSLVGDTRGGGWSSDMSYSDADSAHPLTVSVHVPWKVLA